MRRPAEFIITGYVGSPGSLAVWSSGKNIFEEYGSPALVFFKFIGGGIKNAYELLNLRALKISMLYKNHIFQCMG